MIPVVTDPKKAAGALNWAVAEMEKRYKLFAEYNVRDLKGFNAKVEKGETGEEIKKKLPQIVIIIDELADLMMVAPGEVEGAICRACTACQSSRASSCRCNPETVGKRYYRTDQGKYAVQNCFFCYIRR